jgi:hypothetical protein
MKKITTLFLTISVAAFALSLTGPGSEVLYGGLKPIGAIAFIAFFIANLLSKEVEAYDQEESTKMQSAKKRPEAQSKATGGRVPQHA